MLWARRTVVDPPEIVDTQVCTSECRMDVIARAPHVGSTCVNHAETSGLYDEG